MVPQIIIIIIWTIALIVDANCHGESKDELFQKHNFNITLAHIVIWTLLLWWGGFWECFK